MEEAIKKINDEMQKDPNNTYMEIIGHYLIDRATAEPMVAAAINEPKKTLKGAMDEIIKVAQKKKKGNVAVLTPPQVFETVDKYFGMTPNHAAMYKSLGMDMTAVAVPTVNNVTSAPARAASAPPLQILPGGKKAKKSRVDIDLDDFF